MSLSKNDRCSAARIRELDRNELTQITGGRFSLRFSIRSENSVRDQVGGLFSMTRLPPNSADAVTVSVDGIRSGKGHLV